jgi:PIN domain nuclease of toxin-antitoxin system
MSEIIILDTHIWLWYINSNFDQFPAHWRSRIESANQVGVSSLSCFEIALAHQKGRIKLACSLEEWFQGALSPADITLFSLTPKIASRAVNLSSVHKDPFDRIIIATALEYQANLASIDSKFPQYSELDSYLMK